MVWSLLIERMIRFWARRAIKQGFYGDFVNVWVWGEYAKADAPMNPTEDRAAMGLGPNE